MKKKKLIIDTDPGVDDLIALTLALKEPDLSVQMISTVAGNARLEDTTQNTLDLLDFLGASVPVYRGAEKPLLLQLPARRAPFGDRGRFGFSFPQSEKKARPDAVSAMAACLQTSEEKITLLALGPLTNLALLLDRFPGVLDRIEALIIMGGSLCGGNITPEAEFNAYCDPHALQRILQAELPITLVGLDVTSKARLFPEDLAMLRRAGRTGEMVSDLLQPAAMKNASAGLCLHDPTALAYLLRPDFFRVEPVHLMIETEGPARGATRPIFSEMGEPAHVSCCMDLNGAALRQWLMEGLCT